LAIFPAIAALVAVYGLFSDPTTIMRHLDQMGGCLAAPSMSHASN
jgi:membrane protein